MIDLTPYHIPDCELSELPEKVRPVQKALAQLALNPSKMLEIIEALEEAKEIMIGTNENSYFINPNETRQGKWLHKWFGGLK